MKTPSTPLILCTTVEHRGGFSPVGMFPPSGSYDAFGGREAIHRLVNTLYDRFEADATLRPLFGRDLTEERAKVKLFFEGWFGGSPGYFDAGWRHGLRPAHRHISISRAYAGRWIGHFLDSCTEVCPNPEVVTKLKAPISRLAMTLVNRADEPPPGERLRGNVCGREIKPFLSPVARNDAEGITALTAEYPVALAQHGPSLLLMAAVRGKSAAVDALLRAGVDTDTATQLPGSDAVTYGVPQMEITPLCGALVKGRHAIAESLVAHGARYDIFTAASIGDLQGIGQLLDDAPDLANADDPACDLARITPLTHAVYFRQRAAVELLLKRGADVGSNSARLINVAANAGEEAMVDLLLAHGASAALGAGDWVMFPSIAAKLMAHGADVNREPGRWIGLCCTGNSGHKENLPLANAFLRCGADVHAIYKGRTALHCAAKAGFLRVAEALIAAGADMNAISEAGLTPLQDVENAAKSIDRESMRRLLRERGAAR